MKVESSFNRAARARLFHQTRRRF